MNPMFGMQRNVSLSQWSNKVSIRGIEIIRKFNRTLDFALLYFIESLPTTPSNYAIVNCLESTSSPFHPPFRP
jgi:hypothetical protein